jgi:hypothetical protein
MNLPKDTLAPKGRYELKRVMAFVSFHMAFFYSLVPSVVKGFEVHEFVFIGFLTFAAACIGMNVWNKKIDKTPEAN